VAPYGLVNSQGITRDASIMTMSWEDWHDVIDTNLNGTFAMIRIFVPQMLENGGCIIQISSITANKGVAGQCNYATTKAGLLGLTRSLAVELARFNIRVNAICPGFIETDMLGSLEARKAQMLRSIPLKRMGHVDDVAQGVRFLLSSEASYITGQTLTIDGGITS
jgi:3-oxoacyl-[acyl-carrier protein] reductase